VGYLKMQASHAETGSRVTMNVVPCRPAW
jgi:hypothetical protein